MATAPTCPEQPAITPVTSRAMWRARILTEAENRTWGSADSSVWRGSGEGGCGGWRTIGLGNPLGDAAPRPAAIAVGDFNGDGALDLAIANGIPLNQVTILLGKGDGTFRVGGSFPTGADPRSVLVADFDGDGKLDVATANANRASNLDFGHLSILMGNGDGTFRAPVIYAAGVRPNAAVAADVNG